MDMSRKTIPFSHLRFDEIGLEFLEILNIFETNEKERYIFVFLICQLTFFIWPTYLCWRLADTLADTYLPQSPSADMWMFPKTKTISDTEKMKSRDYVAISSE